MSQNRHWRNGIHRKRWTCPKHRHGIRKTVVGKACPTCGATSESLAAERLKVFEEHPETLPESDSLVEFLGTGQDIEAVVE